MWILRRQTEDIFCSQLERGIHFERVGEHWNRFVNHDSHRLDSTRSHFHNGKEVCLTTSTKTIELIC